MLRCVWYLVPLTIRNYLFLKISFCYKQTTIMYGVFSPMSVSYYAMLRDVIGVH